MKYSKISSSVEFSDEQLKAIKDYMSETVKEFIKEEFFFEVRKQMKAMIKETLVEPIEVKFENFFERINRSVKKTSDTVEKKETEKLNELKKVLETNQNIEEYISNMLTAIRQNEYLQAYYPAQKGYPEMRVVGKHPSKIDDRLAS